MTEKTGKDAAETNDAVTAISGIGPATERALHRAGITTATQLRRIGAHAAYGAMIAQGLRPHFIGYYALVMALQGRPWNDCRGAEKDALRAEFDALVADRAGSGTLDGLPDSPLERLLDRIGTGMRR